MSNIDLFSMAVRNLWKRKLRTFLTILGVVIGTAAIVVMISLGIGMNENFIRQLSQMGNLQVITVRMPGNDGISVSYGANGMEYQSNDGNRKNLVLDERTLEKFLQIQGVESATPVIQDYLVIGAGKYMTDANVIGIDPSKMDSMGIRVEQGEGLTANSKGKAVFGKFVSQGFRNPKLHWRAQMFSQRPEIDIFNEKLVLTYDWAYGTNYADTNIKPYKVTASGILEGEGYEIAYAVYIPLEDMRKIKKEKTKYENSIYGNRSATKGYETAWVKCNTMDAVKAVQTEIQNMGYQASSLADQLEQMQEISNSMQGLLGAIGAVSLFVAAIGITNTMIMAIYERTREIGIMKVIGASIADIQKLFLTEAAFIGFIGGVCGCGLSLFLSFLLNHMNIPFLNIYSYGEGGKISSVPVWLCLGALAFSTFVGIVSGYFPARRAMKLSALTAIKTE